MKNLFKFALILIIGIFSLSLHADEYNQGIEEIKNGNIDSGISYLKNASSKGDYKAAHVLGLIAEKNGDYKASSEYFKQAAEWGNIFKNQKLRTFRQNTGSMKDTIDLDDDFLAIKTDTIKRGELIVFSYPEDKKTFFIYRCVATTGDTLMIKDKDLYIRFEEGDNFMLTNYPNQTIALDGLLWVKNPYQIKHTGIHHDINVVDNNKFPKEIFNVAPVKISNNECFVMGDNRDHSHDSRFRGTVKLEGDIYKPLFVGYSQNPQRIGIELK